MRNHRRMNVDWKTPDTIHWEQVPVELLMDIRGELRRLNELLHCQNFQRIPLKLERIARNTVKPKRKRK